MKTFVIETKTDRAAMQRWAECNLGEHCRWMVIHKASAAEKVLTGVNTETVTAAHVFLNRAEEGE